MELCKLTRDVKPKKGIKSSGVKLGMRVHMVLVPRFRNPASSVNKVSLKKPFRKFPTPTLISIICGGTDSVE